MSHTALITGMRIVSLRGEPYREVPLGDRPLNANAFFWSAEGAGWYLSSTSAAGPSSGTDLLYVDLNGHVTLVWHQPILSAMSAIPSPDGRDLALTRSSMVSNVWMINGSKSGAKPNEMAPVSGSCTGLGH
jgi:hypothetical protein